MKTLNRPPIKGVDMRTTLSIVFGVSLALANVLAAKLSWFIIPGIGGVAVPAGFIGIGVAFVCSDLLSELYGKDVAHSVVNSTILALVVGYGLIYTALMLPVAPFYEANSAYVTTLSSGSAIVAASIISLLVSQHTDVAIFHKIKQATEYKVARNVGSTAVSQLIDTILFISLAFAIIPALQGGEAMPLRAIASIIVGQYIVKLVVAVLDTPIFYAVSYYKQ